MQTLRPLMIATAMTGLALAATVSAHIPATAQPAGQAPAEARNIKAATGYTSAQRRLYIDRLKRIKRALGDTTPIDAGQFSNLPLSHDIVVEARPRGLERKLRRVSGSGQFTLKNVRASLGSTQRRPNFDLLSISGINGRFLANGKRASILLNLPRRIPVFVSGNAREVTLEGCEIRQFVGGKEIKKSGRRDVLGSTQRFEYLPAELPGTATLAVGNGIKVTDDGFLEATGATGQIDLKAVVEGPSILNRTLRNGCQADLPEARKFSQIFELGTVALAHVINIGAPRNGGALGLASDSTTDFFAQRGGSVNSTETLTPQMEVRLGDSNAIIPIPSNKFRVLGVTGGYQVTRNGANLIIASPSQRATGRISIKTIDGELPAAIHQLTTNEVFPMAVSARRVRVGDTVRVVLGVVGDADMSQYTILWEADGLTPKGIEGGFKKQGDAWAALVNFTAEGDILKDFKAKVSEVKASLNTKQKQRPARLDLATTTASISLSIFRKSDNGQVYSDRTTIEIVPEIVGVTISGGYAGGPTSDVVDLFNPAGTRGARFTATLEIAAGSDRMTITNNDALIGRIVRLQATRGAPFAINGLSVSIADADAAPIGKAAIRGVVRAADALNIGGLLLAKGQSTLLSAPVTVTVNRLTQAHFITPNGKRELTVGVLGPADMGPYRTVWTVAKGKETSKPFSQDNGGFIATTILPDFRTGVPRTDVRLGGIVVGSLNQTVGGLAIGGAGKASNVSAIVALEAPALIQGAPLKVRARLANVPKSFWPRLYCAWSVDSIYGRLEAPETEAFMSSTFNGICENIFTLRETLATIDETPNLQVELRVRQGALK